MCAMHVPRDTLGLLISGPPDSLRPASRPVLRQFSVGANNGLQPVAHLLLRRATLERLLLGSGRRWAQPRNSVMRTRERTSSGFSSAPNIRRGSRPGGKESGDAVPERVRHAQRVVIGCGNDKPRLRSRPRVIERLRPFVRDD